MIVMCANNSGAEFRDLHRRFPGQVGWLIGPGGWRTPPRGLPFALDNARYPHFLNGGVWDEAAFYALVEKAGTAARWVVVPDVVANRDATLADWAIHAPRLRALGMTLAFAVQDGMTPADVPPEAAVVFVGGSRPWKWATLTMWTRHFPRVHLAKCNTRRLLKLAHWAGAESTDGTGIFRGDRQQLAGVVRFLEETRTPAQRQGTEAGVVASPAPF